MKLVERTRWMTSTWDCTLNHGCVHWASQIAIDCSGVRFFTVELLWTVSDKLLPPPTPPHPTPHPHRPPTHPLSYACPKLVLTSKNNLKWPKIKQVTNSKLYYIKFHRSISPVLQNKVSLTRTKLVTLIKMGTSTIITRCKLGRFSHGWSHLCTTL